MHLIRKLKSHKNKAYLEFLRSRPCCVTGLEGYGVIAHHVRMFGGGGVGQKPSDYLAVPLSQKEHLRLHANGEKSFWKEERLDPIQVINDCLLAYLDSTDRLSSIVALIDRLEESRQSPSKARESKEE